MRIAASVFALLGIVGATHAEAAPPSGPPGLAPPIEPAPAPPAREVSYALHTLIFDGAAVALIAAGLSEGNNGLYAFLLGVGSYAYGPPIVHLGHGRGFAALGSLGLRFALPMAGAMIGSRVGPADDEHDCSPTGDCEDRSLVGMAVGAIIGGVAASVIDARYLARERVVARAQHWAPTAAATPNGFSVGLGGSF